MSRTVRPRREKETIGPFPVPGLPGEGMAALSLVTSRFPGPAMSVEELPSSGSVSPAHLPEGAEAEAKDQPYRLTPDEAHGVQAIRGLFTKGSPLPADLDTDLNLRRWWNGWRGSLVKIEPRLKAYILNRKAMGWDGADFEDGFWSLPSVTEFAKFFSWSRIGDHVDPKTNSVVMHERLEGVDVRALMRVIPMRHWLLIYFAFSEKMLRAILRQEALSGRPSGVSVVFDMAGADLIAFSNPTSPINKVGQLGMGILQEWYCDILCHMVCFRPPALLAGVWSVCKFALHENTQRKFLFLKRPEDLRRIFHPSVIPVAYGGELRGSPSSHYTDPERCVNVPQLVTEAHFWKIGSVVGDVRLETEWVRPGKSFEVRRTVTKPASSLLYLYWLNGVADVALYRLDFAGKRLLGEEQVTAKLALCTPKLPEEGEIPKLKPGTYALRFTNTSSYVLSVKLQYHLRVRDPKPLDS